MVGLLNYNQLILSLLNISKSFGIISYSQLIQYLRQKMTHGQAISFYSFSLNLVITVLIARVLKTRAILIIV